MKHLLASALALLSIGYCAAQTPTADQPTNDEATKAYRANPYVQGANFGPPLDLARVVSCQPAKDRQGVVCVVAVKYAPLVEEQTVSLYFARKNNGDWNATFENP